MHRCHRHSRVQLSSLFSTADFIFQDQTGPPSLPSLRTSFANPVSALRMKGGGEWGWRCMYRGAQNGVQSIAEKDPGRARQSR